jgi:hypothetical protein
MPITASGRVVADAISLTFSAEVLVARMAPCLQMASSLAKTCFLISMFSNTASMTRSQSASAFRSSEPVSSAMRFSTSSIFRRPRLAVFS